MKRLQLSHALSRRDLAHKGVVRTLMRGQLRAEARRQGLKVGPITFSEYHQEMDGGAFTVLVIEARMDTQ